MNGKPIDRPMKWLGISFVGYIAGWVLLFGGATWITSETLSVNAVLLSIVLLLTTTISYLICLGIVVARTGRSWIAWVGLTFILSPISFLFAYPMMRARVSNRTLYPTP